jgi:hypothetical protein
VQLTPAQIRQLISSAPREEGQVARLGREREVHVAAIAKLDRQIAKLSGGKKGYTLSAATRRKMSEAAKRRYAGGGHPVQSPSLMQ